MTTVKEKLSAEVTANGGELSLRRLFILFSAHARKSYRYSAVKLQGSEGNTLLDRPQDEIVTVDCASLADALVMLLNELLPDQRSEREKVNNADGFATASGSRCFDSQVNGNIRTPGGTWAQTGRCIFNEHYFVETGADTRWFLDPCMFTSYSSKADVMSWKLTGSGGIFGSIVKFIDGDASQVLVRIPLDDPQPKPVGFSSGMVLLAAKDFKPDEFLALRGRRANSGWSDSKYQGNADAAFDRMHKLLKDKAGVTARWAKPT